MSRVRELPVPHFEMETYDWCGPATLKMLLRCYGLQFSQLRLAKMSWTTKQDGTFARGMRRAMRIVGIQCRTKINAGFTDIEEALAVRKPSIVCYLEPYDGEPHYAIPVALTKYKIGLRDSWNSQRRKDKKTFWLTRKDFHARWTNQHRWILIPLHAPPSWQRRRVRP